MALFYTIRRPPCSQCLQNQECTVQNTVLESKEEDEQTVVVVLKFASETLLSPSNVALAKRNPSLRPATKSSELIKFARRVKLCFVHLFCLKRERAQRERKREMLSNRLRTRLY